MASKTPAATANTKAKAPVATATGPNRQPPEEEFWVRYSPHHELPLSSVTSVALHILAIVFLALIGWIAVNFFDDNKPPEVTAVAITIRA
jgi:hypothetical protein